jgi:hypothetical protein
MHRTFSYYDVSKSNEAAFRGKVVMLYDKSRQKRENNERQNL